MLHIYLIFLFLFQTSAIRLGCIPNVTFISNDTKLIQLNFTFSQCACYLAIYNYTGFNYYTDNQTCELFKNFNTSYTTEVNMQVQFCFTNQPSVQNLLTTAGSTSYMPTTLITSIITSTKSVDFTTTKVGESVWNMTALTVAGNGINATLNPYSVFVDDQYYIYIAEKGNNRISKWPPNPNGLASSSIFHTASGQLNAPPSLYVDSKTGDIYVADESNYRVMFFVNGSTTGVNITGVPSSVSKNVNAIYLDPNGTIYITDSNNNRIYKWLTNETVAGGQGSGSSANQLHAPKRVFIDSNYALYITDSSNYRVQKWRQGATSGVTIAGGFGVGSNSSQFNLPLGVAVDSQGNVLVCDTNNHRVQKWNIGASTGQTVAGNGTAGSAANQLNTPRGIALDKDGNLYVADANNYRIQKFNAL
ncbi:unnamed protein product [Adineta steineri]|uniref:NHL repeat containing protein-like protein n=1 Tax=Adineta steineri TaxID=433720 RepID=A0A818XSY3_9BILA|nr:unnamed protein product [Adineta steineri]CAF3743388.1 unnamed protein product [Adineta steineri]